MHSKLVPSSSFAHLVLTAIRSSSPDLRQPETLALLFIIFAISGHFDPKKGYNNDSNEYYYLAKACLRLAARRENTLAYLQTLVRSTLTLFMGSIALKAPNQIHMSQYLHFSGAESASREARWECLSQAVRISYKVR
jgi:hypothetical protein